MTSHIPLRGKPKYNTCTKEMAVIWFGNVRQIKTLKGATGPSVEYFLE
jgi:hypothetical protein